MNNVNRFARAVVWSPVLWGGLASIAFYATLQLGMWTNPTIVRYAAGHGVAYAITTLFCIGMAAVLLKGLNILGQRGIVEQPLLDAIPLGGQKVQHCETLLYRLAQQPAEKQDTYMLRRLREGLEFVYRKNSTAGLDETIRHLAERDSLRLRSSYALIGFVIFALPMLGVLGTVLGIADAAPHDPPGMEASSNAAVVGWGFALDTIALSLSMAVVLLCGKTLVERSERHLLVLVDDRTSAELVGRFEESATAAAPQTANLRPMTDALLQAVEQLVVRQAELWQDSLRASQNQWTDHTAAAARTIESALAGALSQNLQHHANALVAAEQAATEQNRRQWDAVLQAMLKNADAVSRQHHELGRQGELLSQVVGATGDIMKLEQALNRNLQALAGSQHFEETVLSLSAAIHMLSGRFGQSGDAPRPEFKPGARKGHAA